MRTVANEIPQAKDVLVYGISISTFQDGLIAEEVTQSNVAEFLNQMGYPIAHAQLRFGDGIVMLSSSRDDAPSPVSLRSAGAPTFAVHVHVADVDAHHARAKAAGAEIVSELRNTEHGSRDYNARDPEGHLWAFSTYGP